MEAEQKIENALGRTEQFLHDNGKWLLGVIVAIVAVIGGWMAYKHLYVAGRNEKAAEAVYVAQQNFARQLWEAALEGDDNNPGFLDIIERYGSTPTGNLAKHYAGVAYLELGQTDEALEYLEQYKRVDGIPAGIVNAENYGLRGDIMADKGDFAAAAGLFEEAVKAGDDPYTTPMYLKKLGLALVAAGRSGEAVEAYQRILDDYPASFEARDIEKFIGAAEAL